MPETWEEAIERIEKEAKDADAKDDAMREKMKKFHDSPEGKRIAEEADADVSNEDADNN